ncbi:MAG TPA: YihY/virulence factor BrkB family protein, partial [Candidatus Synoicihabitans sp.]|nr:YihY/virulence factor BrkB family protein [Candidatus Synoicihabitans sp.]
MAKFSWLARGWQDLRRVFSKDIWTPASLQDRSLRGQVHAALRVLTITGSGLLENRAASRAAALSFSSLLGLGPLVALAMLVAGFMLDQEDPNLAVNTLNRVIKFIAPQVAEYEKVASQETAVPKEKRSDVVTAATRSITPPPAPTAAPAESAVGESAPIAVNPELVEMINGFVNNSRSGTAGALGALTLILIVIQLFTSIETAFNEIWGVRRGRSWLLRIVFYWTVLTLGAVLFFAALTGLNVAAFINTFAERLPFGDEIVELLQFFVPAGATLLLIAMLTLFYRAIPNTRVFWRAALIGAVVVAMLLIANNTLAFLYFRRVVDSRSLWGSLGILPILMFGLYIFWFFVLL